MGWNHQLDIFRKCFLYIYMAQFCTVSSALKFNFETKKRKLFGGRSLRFKLHFPPEEMLHLWLQNFILQTYDSISRILAEKLDLDFFFSSNHLKSIPPMDVVPLLYPLSVRCSLPEVVMTLSGSSEVVDWLILDFSQNGPMVMIWGDLGL